MGYSTTKVALNWMIEPLGTADRVVLLDRLNLIRQFMYSWYDDLPLFVDLTRCFEVQEFNTDCRDPMGFTWEPTSPTYRGITLPRDMQTIEAIWEQGTPLILRSSWREWQVGISPYCACGLEAIDQGSVFPTERDLVGPSKLRIACVNPADEKKQAIITGTDAFDRPFSQAFSLSTQVQATSESIQSLSRPGGFQKDVTEGRVILTDEQGRALSVYEADETVPAYRRYRISGVRSGCTQVNVRSARQYFAITDENEVIETDNRPALQAMARFIRFNESTDQDRSKVAAAASYLQQAKSLMLGGKSREMGKSAQVNVAFATPKFGRFGLRQLGGGRW